ncbi:MAG: hypothetical protein FJY85_05665, partial [Deltaproteobacteria bacterium]|nr:hypothetical protein [Deltaproteobacteria bacterium]
MFTSLGDLVKRGKEMYAREEMMRQISQLMEDAEHVCIMRPQLRQIAEEMRGALETDEGSFLHDPKRYPYESPAKNDEETIQFFYILGSQNFCIWRRDRKGDVEAWDIHINGQRFVGARGVTAANMRALRIGKNLLDPACLSQLTLKDVEDIYRDEETGQVNLQLLPERQAKFNEIGSVLQEHFNGSFTTLLQRAEGYLFREDGQGIVQQLLTYFPLSYGDWPFCKLAMLTPALLYHRRDKGIPTTEEYLSLTNINDFDNFEIP